MKQLTVFLIFLSAIVVFTYCNSSKSTSVASRDSLRLSADSLAKTIKELSADEFLGRKPFTKGETLTIEYLQSRFRAIGLEPGNGNSFYQEVPMVNIKTEASPSMQVNGLSGSFSLSGPEDYVVWTDKTDPEVSFNQTEVVFAGYGVVAPEYNWNDYANLDVKGKIVLVLVNDPGFNAGDTSLFKGNAMTWYGRWPYKYAEAARQGAKGCLIIHNTKAASYPFKVVQNNWNNAKLHLDNRAKPETYCDIVGWVSSSAAARLLVAAGKDSSLLATADRRGFRGEPLGIKLSTTMRVKSTYDKSHNVVAKITGSKYPDETIIYSAHWDHLGIGAPDERGDSVYNGALDNASGTAALLEIARAFRSMPVPPERTILFLAVTAEEQGLWGSAYYAANPLYPLNKTVANLNMDVLNWFGKTKDIVVVGQGQNDLEDLLNVELKNLGRVAVFDPHPEAGSYYRSDHFNFARVGVPALDLKYGSDVIGKPAGYGTQMANAYREFNYHRPSDQFKTELRFDGAIADIELLFGIGRKLAVSRAWPAWKTGSEFKKVRESQLQK